MDEKEKAAVLAAVDNMNMLEQLMRNYDEDCGFGDVIDEAVHRAKTGGPPLVVGKTPNVLSFGGAKIGLDMVVNPGTVCKCMAPEGDDTWEHGHGLDKDILKYLIFELRNPVMLLKGSKDNTLVAVTDLIDREGRPIIVSVALSRNCERHLVNQITSAYGRNNFDSYLQRQIEFGNLLAVNGKKANQMFQSAGVQFPMEETLISFDNSIAYTFANVKMVSTKIFENIANSKETERETVQDRNWEVFDGSVDGLVEGAQEKFTDGFKGQGSNSKEEFLCR